MDQAVDRDCEKFFSNRITAVCVVLLLAAQAGLLVYSATRHSPTLKEPANLVAGLYHWKFGRFDVYCVNPPLVHYVAAIPVLIAGYNADWSGLSDLPAARFEFQMGDDFIRANGERSIWLFTIARWACIPLSLIGALFCFFWSRDLWGGNVSGLISLFLWCFEPNILAHGELITPDCAAASLGLGACYLFWRWLRQPTWGRALFAGFVLGLAELTKTTWVILFGLWPLLWIFTEWRKCHRNLSAVDSQRPTAPQPRSFGFRRFSQLVVIILVGLYVLNFGYGFDGSFTKLENFTFVSKTLTGLKKPGDPGNRFANSWIRNVRAPVPKQFLRGIDLQKREFEDSGRPSYLRGEWKHGGWWYYYIYGLAVKTPHGSQSLILLAIFTVVYQPIANGGRRERRSLSAPNVSQATTHDLAQGVAASAFPPRGVGRGDGIALSNIESLASSESKAEWEAHDLAVLLAPAIAILALASSQMESNHHVRYTLPVLGFVYVFSGATAAWLSSPRLQRSLRPLSKKAGRMHVVRQPFMRNSMHESS
jgi:hypothetical protein